MSFIGREFDEKDKLREKPLPVWKQEVRDEQGRARFHGAFTGGFSAGYFNTCGSAEGWAPAPFKSSRNARATSKKSTAEEFMDEEDKRAMLAESLTTKPQFAGFRGTAEELGDRSKVTPGQSERKIGPLEELLAPVELGIGVLLLRKMGWRQGKTRIGRPAEIQHPTDRTIGPHPTEDEVAAKRAEIGTRDKQEVHVVEVIPKNDFYGLGYDPSKAIAEYDEVREMRTAVSKDGAPSRKGRVAMISKGREGISGFGLGALEDADDDADVFAEEAIDSYDLEERPRARRAPTSAATIAGKLVSESMPKPTPVKTASGLTISGFVCSTRPPPKVEWFAPAPLPPDYRPYHHFDRPIESEPNSSTIITNDSPGALPSAAPANRPVITPQIRSAILGETVLPTSKGSVFSLLDEEGRKRLANATGKPIPGPFFSQTMPSQASPEKREPAPLPKLSETVLKAPIRTIYLTDPKKQRRYEQFILEQKGDILPLGTPPDGLGEEDWWAERTEFAHAAVMFRPVTGPFADRFTASTEPLTGIPVPSEPLRKPQSQTPPVPTKSPTSEPPMTAKVFTKPIRTEQEWTPANLLCKRFNVSNPRPGQPEGIANPEKKSSTAVLSTAAALAPTQAEKDRTSLDATPESSVGEDIDQERPPIDLFKAIFEPDPEPETPQKPIEPEPEPQKVIAEPPAEEQKPAPVVPVVLPLPSSFPSSPHHHRRKRSRSSSSSSDSDDRKKKKHHEHHGHHRHHRHHGHQHN